MMTKAAALQSFFEGFGIPAYPSTSVPDEAEMPYLTYAPYFAAFGDGQVNIQVNIWMRTESEAKANAKAQELADAIGRGGVTLDCDGGAVWLTRGSPWCQPVRDDDSGVRRRLVNVNAEYLTAD
jgi:hypothetical protein